MIKGIIFDLDHTLFDRYATLRAVAKTVAERLPTDTKLGIEEIADIMIESDKRRIHRGWEALEEYVVESTGLFVSDIPKGAYFNCLLESFMTVAVPYSFTEPMLKKLKNEGFKIGLITNGRVGLQEKKLEMLGITDYFDEIIISGKYGCPKPSPIPFEMMSERLKLLPSEMMYVGDHPKNDVDASRRVGYVPVFVNTAGYWSLPEIEKCELTVETVAEIPELVKNYNKRFKL